MEKRQEIFDGNKQDSTSQETSNEASTQQNSDSNTHDSRNQESFGARNQVNSNDRNQNSDNSSTDRAPFDNDPSTNSNTARPASTFSNTINPPTSVKRPSAAIPVNAVPIANFTQPTYPAYTNGSSTTGKFSTDNSASEFVLSMWGYLGIGIGLIVFGVISLLVYDRQRRKAVHSHNNAIVGINQMFLNDAHCANIQNPTPRPLAQRRMSLDSSHPLPLYDPKLPVYTSFADIRQQPHLYPTPSAPSIMEEPPFYNSLDSFPEV